MLFRYRWRAVCATRQGGKEGKTYLIEALRFESVCYHLSWVHVSKGGMVIWKRGRVVSERNNLERVEKFRLNAKSRIWS